MGVASLFDNIIYMWRTSLRINDLLQFSSELVRWHEVMIGKFVE